MPTRNSRRPPDRRDVRRPPEGHAAPMPRRSKRDIFNEARPHVDQAIETLTATSPDQAAAVRTVLEIAEDAVQAAEARAEREASLDKNFAIPVSSALYLQTMNSPNVTKVVLDGWRKFLDGKWQPVEPVRAMHGAGVAKSNVNLRVPKGLLEQVEAAADRMVEENGWRKGRGTKLNANQVAVQWLARTFPPPKGALLDQWSENERQAVAQAAAERAAKRKKKQAAE